MGKKQWKKFEVVVGLRLGSRKDEDKDRNGG
jgi:hypothetical protein